MRWQASCLAAGAAALGVAGVVGAAIARTHGGPARVIELSGIVEATEVDLRAELAGTIARVPFEEGERVEKGALVCAIDEAKIAAEARRAEADVAAAAARLALLKNGARREERERGQARVAVEEARVRDAERTLRQARELTAAHVASKDEIDRAELALDQARASLAVAQRDLDLVNLGPREEEIAAGEAQLAQAKAAADLARLRVADARVAAPLASTLTKRYVEPGESVPTGGLLLTLADLERVRVKVYVTERDLAALKIGGPVEVLADAFPGRPFPGRIARLATEAEFTPRNLQTKEDRVKLVYETRVEVPNPEGALKPGMPVDVRLPLVTEEGLP